MAVCCSNVSGPPNEPGQVGQLAPRSPVRLHVVTYFPKCELCPTGYDPSMTPRNHSLGFGASKVEQPGGSSVGRALPGPCPPPRRPQGVRAGRQVQPGAATVGTGRRLTPAAKQTVQMMLAAWALRELAARRATQSHSRKGQPR